MRVSFFLVPLSQSYLRSARCIEIHAGDLAMAGTGPLQKEGQRAFFPAGKLPWNQHVTVQADCENWGQMLQADPLVRLLLAVADLAKVAVVAGQVFHFRVLRKAARGAHVAKVGPPGGQASCGRAAGAATEQRPSPGLPSSKVGEADDRQ